SRWRWPRSRPSRPPKASCGGARSRRWASRPSPGARSRPPAFSRLRLGEVGGELRVEALGALEDHPVPRLVVAGEARAGDAPRELVAARGAHEDVLADRKST